MFGGTIILMTNTKDIVKCSSNKRAALLKYSHCMTYSEEDLGGFICWCQFFEIQGHNSDLYNYVDSVLKHHSVLKYSCSYITHAVCLNYYNNYFGACARLTV